MHKVGGVECSIGARDAIDCRDLYRTDKPLKPSNRHRGTVHPNSGFDTTILYHQFFNESGSEGWLEKHPVARSTHCMDEPRGRLCFDSIKSIFAVLLQSSVQLADINQ